MHYTQFNADNRFVCAGHNETARQKSCCTHCILCWQAVVRKLEAFQNHMLVLEQVIEYAEYAEYAAYDDVIIFEIIFISKSQK